MAYKRRTKKTGPNTKSSTTYSTTGPSTFSHSSKSGGVTYTSTSKGGKYYMTRTQRFANGFVERKRIVSSSPKKVASQRKRRSKSSSGGGFGWLVLFGIVGLLALIFNG